MPGTFQRRPLAHWVATALLTLTSLTPSLAFSGNDLLNGLPWYHEEITETAAKAVGFTPEAADTLAWHADYVDSYLYNPYWWVLGGIDRFKVNLSTKGELAKLHFDDLFSADGVRHTYRRYLTGTLAGLIWASERNDVSAARNVVGISLHAIQDFYSHSNWVDAPARRNLTWFEAGRAERFRAPIWAGSYELPHHQGIKPHGTFVPECAFLDLPAVRDLLSIGCQAWSPLTKFSVCETYRLCQNGVSLQPEVLGVTLPTGTLFLSPAGIALDSPWQSDIAVQVRGLTDISGQQAFQTAVDLATRASIQWLTKLEASMTRIGRGAFWEQVKTTPYADNDQAQREAEYEQFHRLPYTFLSAGPYPPAQPARTTYADGTYLRVRLKTSSDSGAGTDANIALTGFVGNQPGRSFILDYMPKANPLIAYNDFEAGDNTVYVVGPFEDLPNRIDLQNRAPDLPNVIGRLAVLFISAVGDYIVSLRDFFLSLIGGHADPIGTRNQTWTAEQLKGIGSEPQPFTIDVNGGGEGHYKVHGTIRKTDETNDTTPWGGYYKFQVRLETLECVRESVSDRGSDSDEPFVLALLQPLPGEIRNYRSELFDMDAGETDALSADFQEISLPKSYGMLNLAVSLFESDDETSGDRTDLLEKFQARFQVETGDLVTEVATTLGEAIGADWKLEEIEIYAFSRGESLRTGTVLSQRPNRFIDAGESMAFSLVRDGLRGWPEIDLEALEDVP